MSIKVHPLGTPRRIEVTFFNINCEPQDPITATLFVENPFGVTTQYGAPAVVNDPNSVGKFYCDVLIDLTGEWHYRWVGSGALSVQAAQRGEFKVEPGDFTPI
jgi:hypothetical protein